jgi:hypothetical protein
MDDGTGATDEEQLFEVECLVDVRIADNAEEPLAYLVRWHGYPPDQATWEPTSAIPHEARVEFHKRRAVVAQFASCKNTARVQALDGLLACCLADRWCVAEFVNRQGLERLAGWLVDGREDAALQRQAIEFLKLLPFTPDPALKNIVLALKDMGQAGNFAARDLSNRWWLINPGLYDACCKGHCKGHCPFDPLFELEMKPTTRLQQAAQPVNSSPEKKDAKDVKDVKNEQGKVPSPPPAIYQPRPPPKPEPPPPLPQPKPPADEKKAPTDEKKAPTPMPTRTEEKKTPPAEVKQGPSPDSGSRVVSVFNLPVKPAVKKKIRQEFEELGKVTQWSEAGPGVCYVEFETSKEALAACKKMNGRELPEVPNQKETHLSVRIDKGSMS